MSAAPEPIAGVAGALGLLPDEYATYGRHAAKIELAALEERRELLDGRLVCVTAVTPTKAGEGKTTTAISLTDALGLLGKRPVLCLREPSLGPVFGIKGGGTGGGRAQVVPMESINLHFTGDIHAIAAANNLLAAMLEAHVLHGNPLGVDPISITWKRCVDMNDRALRQTVIGLGGRLNGLPRETGFDITAASEVMAVVAMARGVEDLRERLGAIT
ncbi:MAG: formate--tetrahydrofolate ligase, partial [Actinobacteria bacterium]|nr:formate--tetrahydrofolate ligase [Actinomycetota bacterium]